jgi:hypothetical protein
MVVFESLARIDLTPGDVIVAATPFRDYVLVFTQMGRVYRVRHDG